MRTFRRRQRAQQTQQQSADNTNAEPQASEQASEQQQAQQQQPEQPQEQRRQGLNNQAPPASQAQPHPPQAQSQSQSEAQPPRQQQQRQQQQQSQAQPGNIFNLISNIIGNMQGAPPGMGMPFSFQVPPTMHVPPPPPPSGMSSNATGRASGPGAAGPNAPPPGLSFLMNMMAGQGPSGVSLNLLFYYIHLILLMLIEFSEDVKASLHYDTRFCN